MSTQDELDKPHACHACGERGRYKAVLNIGGALKLLCHDEEKSCYFAALRELDRRIG
jgi:hypothetical protein